MIELGLGLAMTNDKFKQACTRRELHEASFIIRHIRYRKQPISAIIFAFEDNAYAYVNE
jgi:hypothetical protein